MSDTLPSAMGEDAEGLSAEVRKYWNPASGWGDVDEFGVFEDVVIAGITVRFRLIPAGEFVMGSPDSDPDSFGDEKPQHKVTLTQPYWLAEAPTTQALWQAVMGENASHLKGAQRPVERVSWKDAQTFLKKAEIEGLCLPTEAQWEHACRAGTLDARYHAEIREIAWFYHNSGKKTHPVKQLLPNPWGLYDILGNVWEWCTDYSAQYSGEAEVDPTGPVRGAYRVSRGGSCISFPKLVRAAFRNRLSPGDRYQDQGFRLSRAFELHRHSVVLDAESP